MNTKFLTAIVTGLATVAVALIGLYNNPPAFADGIKAGTINGAVNNFAGDVAVAGNFNVNDNSNRTIEGAKVANLHMGDKVFNIKAVNGDVNITPRKNIEESVAKRANSLNIKAYEGFSEVFFDEKSNSFYIKNHKGNKPKLEKLEETSIDYKHIEIVAVNWNVDNINGDVQNEKNVYIKPTIADSSQTNITYGSVYIDNKDLSKSYSFGLNIEKNY